MIGIRPHSHLKPHFWKLRAGGFRELMLAHHWRPRGAYCSKLVCRHDYMLTVVEKTDAWFLCKIQRKSDYWADVERECLARRAADGRPSPFADVVIELPRRRPAI